ncbi:agamous-like MADS-box protein AGL80 [Solanum dulcamara]|uniref:agamous-like MADS-box protein AGL80 n=1 Tax=Solanum dulcamara TaxID=45834 RepID=UPI002485B378|nr:agamous-like MADS-box protein AGL80 [Solanum dulcamara]
MAIPSNKKTELYIYHIFPPCLHICCIQQSQKKTMTRKKVKLAFITNDSARKATFKKRKKGLMKKVSELSTLCGIDACAIIYSPYDTSPEVWPNTIGAQRVLAEFKRMPEMEQSKKMVNQESFIRQRIAKASEQLKKQSKENREKEMTEIMYQGLTGKGLQNLNLGDLNDLGWVIDQNLKEVYKRIEAVKKGASTSSSSSVAAASQAVAPQKPAVVELGLDGMQRTQTEWFSDWMNSNTSDQHIGYGHADEMILPNFNDHQNTNVWPNNFYP